MFGMIGQWVIYRGARNKSSGKEFENKWVNEDAKEARSKILISFGTQHSNAILAQLDEDFDREDNELF